MEGEMSAGKAGKATATRALARFVAGFRASRLPAAVRSRTLELVLDGTGALASAANPAFATGRLIAAFVREQGGRSQASIVGHGFRSSVANAALANGTMGYASDVEPHHPEAILHPIAVMIPTALAVGEHAGSTGAEFLAAVAIGCEVEYRVSMALGPAEQYALGFHPSAVCGCFGATAAAAFLLGLDEDACVRAFGLDLPFASAAFAYLVAMAAAALAPTPGGLVAIEVALTAALIGVGLDAEEALATALLFRVVTFWLPVVPGWLALVSLERRGEL
jgi:2-methylcitrate dehydratase PrpD